MEVISNSQSQTVLKSSNMDKGNFTVKVNKGIFMMLSQGLYKDPHLAVVRELCCNALDAHRMVGTVDTVPIEVHFPTELEPWLEVKDYGPGMPYEFVMDRFTSFGDSIKSGDDSELTEEQKALMTGGLGIGSKSPLAIANSYTVISVHKGLRSVYICDKNGGLPEISVFVKEEPTNKPDGVTVRVDGIKRYSSFIVISRLFDGFPLYPKVTGEKTYLEDPQPFTSYLDGKLLLNGADKPLSGSYSIDCKIGDIVYHYSPDFNPQNEFFKRLFSLFNAVIQLPPGSCDILPSREGLVDSKKTKETVNGVLGKIYNELKPALEKAIRTDYESKDRFVASKVDAGIFIIKELEKLLGDDCKLTVNFGNWGAFVNWCWNDLFDTTYKPQSNNIYSYKDISDNVFKVIPKTGALTRRRPNTDTRVVNPEKQPECLIFDDVTPKGGYSKPKGKEVIKERVRTVLISPTYSKAVDKESVFVFTVEMDLLIKVYNSYGLSTYDNSIKALRKKYGHTLLDGLVVLASEIEPTKEVKLITKKVPLPKKPKKTFKEELVFINNKASNYPYYWHEFEDMRDSPPNVNNFEELFNHLKVEEGVFVVVPNCLFGSKTDSLGKLSLLKELARQYVDEIIIVNKKQSVALEEFITNGGVIPENVVIAGKVNSYSIEFQDKLVECIFKQRKDFLDYVTNRMMRESIYNSNVFSINTTGLDDKRFGKVNGLIPQTLPTATTATDLKKLTGVVRGVFERKMFEEAKKKGVYKEIFEGLEELTNDYGELLKVVRKDSDLANVLNLWYSKVVINNQPNIN